MKPPGKPDLPPLTATQLSALIGVAEAGSFGEAALRLGVAQSTVSHAVRAAEDALGTSLFERGRHGARLTPGGERVLEHARHAFHALQAMALAARGSSALSGTLHVASCRSVLRHFVTPALRRFGEEYPGVGVAVHDTSGEHDDIERMVAGGEAHLGLGRLPMRAGLVTGPLFADEYLIVQAADAPPLGTWDDLHRAAYIVCDEDCAPHLASHIAHCSRPPQPAVRLRDPAVALGMVAEGHGFTILSRLVVTPLPPGVRVQPLPTPLWRTIGAVMTPGGAAHPLVEAFRRVALSPSALRANAGRVAALLRFPNAEG